VKVVIVVLVNLFLFGCCPEKHHQTKRIYNSKFYMEFGREWTDMGVCYLTDSTNFRVKVTRYNIESEYFNYQLKQDSISIEKWTNYPLPKHMLETKSFSIKKLIEEGKLNKR
jgi:hypothetical protein